MNIVLTFTVSDVFFVLGHVCVGALGRGLRVQMHVCVFSFCVAYMCKNVCGDTCRFVWQCGVFMCGFMTIVCLFGIRRSFFVAYF